jgi:hypothetical protein
MGHCVTGLIARPEVLEAFARERSLHAPVPLHGDLSILPLRDSDLDSFLKPPLTGYPEGFTYLASSLVQELLAASVNGGLLYFETEYFGGKGSQGAAVFRAGEIAYGPKAAEVGPINEALGFLGVHTSSSEVDAFQTVGLDRHRWTAAWLGLDDDAD